MFRFGHRGGFLLLASTVGLALAGGLIVAASPALVPVALLSALGPAVAAPAPPAVPMPRRTTGPDLALTTATPTTDVVPQAPIPVPAPTSATAAATSAPVRTATTQAPRREVLRAVGPVTAVVAATNTERKSAGCPALKHDPRLTAAAQKHAADMANRRYFSHTSKDGRTFDARIRAEGYRSPGGENIARGQATEAEVVEDWMESPGHRRNIENCSFRTIGVGHDPDGNYWVQEFGR